MTTKAEGSSTLVSGYLATLDGWRAIAVFSVIAYHASLWSLGPLKDSWLHTQGFLGVDLFFAISGLLICSRLLDEEAKSGYISLRNFYVRRTFRILPPMIAYLAAIAVLGAAHIIHVGRNAWLASFFFLNNYYGAFRRSAEWSLYTNHFWSLAVEEHFYLLLPALLVFFPKIRVRLLTSLTVLFLFWNLLHAALIRHDALRVYSDSRTDLRIYELLFPALLAIFLQRPEYRKRCTQYCRPWVVLLIIVASGIFAAFVWIPIAYKLIVPFGFPFLILSTVLHPHSWIGRVLESLPLRALGRISYSIYLWQQLFFVENHSLSSGILRSLQSSPWNFIFTLGLATASYFVLEKPLIRIGHRLAPSATAGHPDLGNGPC